MTEAQERLKQAHGTPPEYAVAVWRACPEFLSVDEAQAAVVRYLAEWGEAGAECKARATR